MKSALYLLGLVAAASAAAIREDTPMTFGDLGWEGSVTPGGPVIEVWGTSLDDIESKIQKEYPGFSMSSGSDEELPDTSDDPAAIARRDLEPRADNCRVFGSRVNFDDTYKNFRYLRGVQARCKAKARTCVKTKCQGKAGTGLCNDNYHEISLNCKDYAHRVIMAATGCHRGDTTCGQAFTGDKWNAIIATCSYFKDGSIPV